MKFVFDPATLSETLMMTLKGMVGIFAVIFALMFVIWLLNKTTKTQKRD